MKRAKVMQLFYSKNPLNKKN